MTQMVFGILSLLLMFSTNALAAYSFFHHRYIYKRLVACLYAVIGKHSIINFLNFERFIFQLFCFEYYSTKDRIYFHSSDELKIQLLNQNSVPSLLLISSENC